MLPTTDHVEELWPTLALLGYLGQPQLLMLEIIIYTKTISSHYLFDPVIWLNDEIMYWIYELPYGRFCKIIHFEIQYAVFKDQIKSMRVLLGETGFQFTSKKNNAPYTYTSWGASAVAIHTMPLETGNVSPQTSSTGGNAVTGAGLGEGGSEGAEGTPVACQVKGLKGGRSILLSMEFPGTTYILPIGWLYITYHLLREPETAIDPFITEVHYMDF